MKLLVIAALVTLLAFNAKSFRVVRQVEDVVDMAEEEVVAAAPEEEVVAAAPEEEVVAAAPEEEEVVAAAPEEEEEEEMGTLTKVTEKVKSAYNNALTQAKGYIESIRGLKLEEKARNLYTETVTIATTYAGIVQDQAYHIFTSQQ